MINLKQAKTLIGVPVLTPATKPFIVTKARKLENGTVLIYNKYGWCCNVEVIKDTKRQKFVFEEENKLLKEKK